MKALGSVIVLAFLFSAFPTLTFALSDAEAAYITRRQLLTLPKDDKLPDNFDHIVDLKDKTFENERLKKAYIALQAFKQAVYSDPLNTTANWVGTDVCTYNGVFCATAMDNSNLKVVASIDLNGADIAAHFPPEMGLLTDLTIFHMNSNRICGIIPETFTNLKLMHEFDVSNNRLVGPFPKVSLTWPENRYIDFRYNNFEGELPPELFTGKLDAIFLHNNRFSGCIPSTIGYSIASVVTFAHNNFTGCIPRSIGNMTNLNEILFLDNQLSACQKVSQA
ncbi:Leucine-rich repeat family protein [Melia azedarach]|uniref:Leucine-rich repeat family protein n=1 Tax=Melia azedarach TaxID=155640 RepID=A0ACC1XYP8_MELAZ|nr:Leucine-rich repeat family protein [Melia azedarach]